jgi:peptidoglycan hydrolase CwlO-like protein
MDPVARVDAAIEAWSTLRAALETIGEELDASRQSLREAKEQLSVLHAENDQQQLRIDALEAEVAERKSLVDEARMRLQDAAKALGAHDPSDEPL